MSSDEWKAAYWIAGFVVVSNFGLIVTMLGAGARAVYRYAVLIQTLKALHRRVDKLDGLGGPEDDQYGK